MPCAKTDLENFQIICWYRTNESLLWYVGKCGNLKLRQFTLLTHKFHFLTFSNKFSHLRNSQYLNLLDNYL